MENAIRRGMAQAFWMSAWADWQESGECPPEHKVNLSGAKIEEVCGEPNPPQADVIDERVDRLVGQLMALNEADVTELFHAACAADKLEGTDGEAVSFGYYLAMQSVGSGVSWFDDHETFDLAVPYMTPYMEWSWCDLPWPVVTEEAETKYVSGPLGQDAENLFRFLGLDREDLALLSCSMNGQDMPVVCEVTQDSKEFVLTPRAILLTGEGTRGLVSALRDPHGDPLPGDAGDWLNHPDGEGWWWSEFKGEVLPTQVIKDDSIPNHTEWQVYELGRESVDVYNNLSDIKSGLWKRMLEAPPVPPSR